MLRSGTANGGAPQGFSMNDDTTPARQTVLLEQAAWLRCILETVPDAIVVIDQNAIIHSFSTAAEKQFGYRADEVIGRNVNMLMPSPYREEHDAYVHRYRTTGERRIIGIGREVLGRRKDGSIFPMYLSVGEGQLQGASLFVGIIHDITEQQATERRLRALQDELLQVSRLSGMGQMASALAHELNQPLTAIVTYMQSAKRLLSKGDAGAIGRAQDAVDRTAQQALRAGEIIRRLREFVASGDTDKIEVRIDMIITEALALARASNKFGVTRVTLNLRDAAHVVVDKVQIQQVVLNLIRNALEAMEGTTASDLILSTRSFNDGVEVSVADRGPGISPEIKEHLFQPFVTTKRHGTGVGLAISRTIIESHGGRMWADANPDGGAIFRFTLPRAPEEATDGTL
jgi:two-component system sensor kinase FixL